MPDRSSSTFLQDLVRPGTLRAPLRLTDKDSWQGHIPFAFWCIDELRPRVLVELGCHKGDSFCAFCQAVEAGGAETRCYAVDTWKGDPLAGFYGEEVYEELRQYHDPRYGAFSRLVRSSFDEALCRFPDASVDLLHIDGAHGYEEVLHDFSTWLPKLSPSGVVLLHDIEVREAGFGVFRLWAELRRAYPSFSFPHSLGLGVLAVGASPPLALRRLTSLDDREAEEVRRLFARLGEAVSLKGTHNALARQRVRLAELGVAHRELESSYQAVEALLRERERQVVALGAQREAIFRSTSWRLAAPVRFVGRLARRLRGERGPEPAPEGAAPAPPEPPPPLVAEAEAERGPAAPAPGPEPAAPPPRPGTFVRALLGDPGWTITFPPVERPDVSIVMLTMNKVEYTYDSLESLLARADVPCELIVVDNGSTDETLDLLSRLRNVTVVRNEANRGFGPACNQGAARARGEYLLFLNNDAEIAPGCLSALLRAARAEPRCGAVGGKLVWPDGRLQEAGSILWDDGTAEACGRGGHPGAPEVSYMREVDFCSGALLLVRRELFETLGGFDNRFSPIYYEDVDLCVGIRGLGFRVLYQPAAVARHQEYGTTSARATELMRRNQARFLEKRQAELAGQHPRAGGSLRARERTARPRLLVIDDRVPTSDAGSGYPRAHALLRLLRRRGYPVTFFPAYDPTPYQPWLRELQLAGVEMICDGRPFASFASERAGLYDVVLVSRPHNLSAVQADLTRSLPRAILIYDAEALFFVREEAEAAIGESPVLPELAERQRRELDLFRFAHRIVAVSEREKRFLERAAPEYRGQIEVWGHPVEVRPTPSPFADRRDLLFLGSFFAPGSPNKDALNYLVRDVLPLVTAHIDCRLDVVGHSAAAAVVDYASARVAVLGYAEDLTPHYDTHRVLVVPHRYSAGIPLKLCEAMARGLPAVVSDLTAQQLGVEDGREVLVGHTPEELAECVVRLYTDEAMWNELRANSLRFVRRYHDPETLGRALDDIVAGALAAGPTIKE